MLIICNPIADGIVTQGVWPGVLCDLGLAILARRSRGFLVARFHVNQVHFRQPGEVRVIDMTALFARIPDPTPVDGPDQS